jgi:hypothetical protein
MGRLGGRRSSEVTVAAAFREDKTLVSVDLECLSCHQRGRVDLTAEMFKELSASWKMLQNCGVCGEVTEWSFAEAPVEAEEQVDFWDWVATTGEFFERGDAAKQDERRKEPRIDVQVPLRIAAADGEEEMVTSQNISKTGLCFLSLKAYKSGEMLEVTLQPPGALAPQTKTATIVRSTPAGSGMTLYGARIEP